MPVATKNTLSLRTRSSVSSTRSRSWPARSARRAPRRPRGASRAWITPPRHFTAHAAMMPSGVPPTPSSRSMPLPAAGRDDRACDVAVGDEPDARAGLADLVDQLARAGPVQHDDGDILGRPPLALATAATFSATGAGCRPRGRLRPGDQLVHVEHGRRVVHRAALGDRHDRDRVVHALGGQRGAVDRVDRDVDVGAGAVADLLAVEKHRRVVLLALADDHDALHRDGVDQLAHGVDGGAVGAVLVAARRPSGRRPSPRPR